MCEQNLVVRIFCIIFAREENRKKRKVNKNEQ